MFSIIVTIITVFYVLVCLFMILVILLQAGRGGMGTALGGGASQSVFGGGGSSDVLAKVTQFCAGSFMVFAMFLAYAGAHSGSARLQEKSEELAPRQDEDGEFNWEAIGPNPIDLTRYASATPPEPAAVSEPVDAANGEPAVGEAPAADSGAAAEAPAADSGTPAEAPADPAAPADAPAEPADAQAP